MNPLNLFVLSLALVSPLCDAMEPLLTIPQSANWFGYGWLWLDFGMLWRESVCSALVNNQTDLVLFGQTAGNQLAVMGKNNYGYLVGQQLLSAGESSAHYSLSLSDRYEIEPEHLFLEWRNISWFKVEDEIVSMYLYDEGPNQGSMMAIQTTTRRIRLVHQSFTVISENWTPPDGLLFLSSHKRPNSTGKPLAIYNLPDRFCVIFHKWQLDKM